MSVEINMEESWNEYHEDVLRQWGEASACYRYMHHRAFLMFKRMSLRFNLPVIVLSTITGTANFAQTSFPESMRATVPSIIGGMNLIAGLIATIMQFLKINELMENHRTAALGHGSLSRNIRLQLSLPRVERKKEGLKFVDECKSIYDSLLEQSPPIPKHILMNFDKEYPLDSVFTKPEILNVRPIPKLKLPKTIEPIHAITKDTPFERVGEFLVSKQEEEEEEEEEEYEEEEEEEETDVEQGKPVE
jgi:cell division ATPase FtsA